MECYLKQFGSRVYRVRPVGGGGENPRMPAAKASAAAVSSTGDREVESCGPGVASRGPVVDIEELVAEGVEELEDGGYSHTILVPSCLVKFVVGKGGSTRTAIQKEHKVELTIAEKEDRLRRTAVTIVGGTGSAVVAAKYRLAGIIASATSTCDYTHFLCVPLTEAAADVAGFQSGLLTYPDAARLGIEESVFVSPRQLHLTLVMLRLLDDEMVTRASAVLRDLAAQAAEIFGPTPLSTTIQGLEYMNDDPSAVHVLYGKLTEGPATSAICCFVTECVIPALKAARLIDDEELTRQRLKLPSGQISPKLHVTLLNTKLRRRPIGDKPSAAPAKRLTAAEAALAEGMDHSDDFEGGSSVKPFADRIPIDARELITEWADTVIASAAVREVHLSARGKFGPNGFYRPVYTLKLC